MTKYLLFVYDEVCFNIYLNGNAEEGDMHIKNLLIGFLLMSAINQISYANNNCARWLPMPVLDGLVVVMPIYNVNITEPDLDCDGIIDTQDNDIDGDGVANSVDAFPKNL